MISVIYDNVIFNLQKSGGISVYWKELIERIQKENSVHLEILEYQDAECNIFRKDLNFNDVQVKIMSSFPSLKINRYINPQIKGNGNKIFHSSYYRTVKAQGVKNIVTVHDFTYERKLKSFVSKFHIYQKMKALKNADGIICISKNTKKDMLELYPELREKNIKVIYNGFSSNDYVYDENIPFENLALFVGARKGYKNFDKAVEVVAATEDLKLIIVGAALDRLEKELLDRTLPKRYHLFTHVSNEKLNELYNKSICLLYLSEYEGFGIPVLEAMSAGCPIVALKKSSIPEVAGDAGILFSNFDKNALQKTIELLRDNKELRTKQIELGLNNAKRFSWDKCYKEVLDFYNEVI